MGAGLHLDTGAGIRETETGSSGVRGRVVVAAAAPQALPRLHLSENTVGLLFSVSFAVSSGPEGG